MDGRRLSFGRTGGWERTPFGRRIVYIRCFILDRIYIPLLGIFAKWEKQTDIPSGSGKNNEAQLHGITCNGSGSRNRWSERDISTKAEEKEKLIRIYQYK